MRKSFDKASRKFAQKVLGQTDQRRLHPKRILLELAYGHGMSAARLADITVVQKFDSLSVEIIFMNESSKICREVLR